ncbi:isoform II [Sphaerochaeta pleomorpha str. Grapes]|uniref:Isoform II n=1 Tax=Sphaerochaeta pleomorpha (strain ATCC BAA-1885 / DSM 22778 / Grapes) TaxID=158190 RepID=G8QST0_SPHPG|nr:dienelactone hydrolase family protein [Sphaerochaeta pleomorpha]AEV30112.1 isoform II [Sphaerochaeta pleomorpha str. Grapes]
MRTIEFTLLALVFGSVIGSFAFNKKNKRRQAFLLVLSSIVFFAHGVVEGLRLQMGCVYLALPILWLIFLFSKKKISRKKQISVISLSLLCLLGTLLSLYLFPVNTMPKPTGPYTVGTDSYELTESGRKELYGQEPHLDRHIRFQVWYPADTKKGGKLTKWLVDGRKVASGIPVMYKLPDFLLDHTALVKSHSYKGLPISNKEQTYPLVIISHGWTGFSSLHSDLGEMFASHGYIAVSINHTYGAAVSVFENGEVVYVDPKALPDRASVSNFDVYSHALVSTFANDDRAVLDFMETNPFFSDRIDKQRIGAMGHSTGGGGAVSFAITDSRIKAVLGFDAWVEPIDTNILEKGLQIPNAFLRSEQWETGPNNAFLKQLFENTTVKPSIYQVQGGNHQDFSMLYMYLPITRILGATGSLDPLKNAEIQQSYALTFFDQNLKQEEVDLQTWFRTHIAVSKITEFE